MMSDQMLDQLKSYLDDKLVAFQNAARTPIPPTVKPVVLKNKGNQSQADFCTTLLRMVGEMKLIMNENNTEASAKKLSEMEAEINKRIKLIKLADRSEGGWHTVNEYLSDDLASGSEDERRIRRAENAAQKKFKKRKLEHRPSAGNSQQTVQHQATPRKQFFRDDRKSFRFEDRCFACGQTGHWRMHCPNVSQPIKTSSSPKQQ